MANEFTYGEVVRLTATFIQNSTAVNPLTVTLIIDEPNSTGLVVTTPSTSIENPATGTFYYDYDASSTGLIEYRWKSVTPQGARESWFTVAESRVPNP
jgi:hypothetical protein